MDAKQCKKCACIYPASSIKCPSCGSYRRKPVRRTVVNKSTLISAELIEVHEQEKNYACTVILTALFLGRLGILWAMLNPKKANPQIATFAVYEKNCSPHRETVKVGSNRYYELLAHIK